LIRFAWLITTDPSAAEPSTGRKVLYAISPALTSSQHPIGCSRIPGTDIELPLSCMVADIGAWRVRGRRCSPECPSPILIASPARAVSATCLQLLLRHGKQPPKWWQGVS
jgi:hypothetical protein